ncbi:MAG: hypothetical protein F6K41_26125 [Symploca sp. SIO3E6]|nr:hypothetical protein [Caldora sp. SIO3E6]
MGGFCINIVAKCVNGDPKPAPTVINSQFPIPNSQFSIPNSQFSIPNSQ